MRKPLHIFNSLKTDVHLHYIQKFLSSHIEKQLHVHDNASQLMLYKAIIAVLYENYTKHRNTLCGQIVEFLNVRVSYICSYHWALNG
jgi:hypothetical protein